MTTETYRAISLDDAMRAQLEAPRVQPTSRAAYQDSVTSGRGAAQEARILAAIRAAGDDGMTLDESAVKTGIALQSASGAVTALKKRGSIKRNGTTRPTRMGRAASVWVATKSEGASA